MAVNAQPTREQHLLLIGLIVILILAVPVGLLAALVLVYLVTRA
jgi:hypothetical protein